ncbi:hypothetical protein BDZ91DRAFT_711868 [Kalaharituber pfeilii]|nr:hypothetical protein BDZ91DRAFT_711868 [Kalaharituber pfeilii]
MAPVPIPYHQQFRSYIQVVKIHRCRTLALEGRKIRKVSDEKASACFTNRTVANTLGYPSTAAD